MTLHDIKVYTECYEMPTRLDILIDCIFMMDNDFIDSVHKKKPA